MIDARYRILIADDEPIERLVVRKFVDGKYEGQLETVVAENGKEAVEVFRSEGCSIALLDIEMPGMDGLNAAAQIREEFPDAKIIFLTAFDEFNYAKRAISVRALEYLLKPVDHQELMLVIDEAIRLLDEDAARKAANEIAMNTWNAVRDAGAEECTNDLEPSDAGTNSQLLVDGADLPDGSESGKLGAIRHRIAKYLDENYMRDLAVSDVAQTLRYSDAYFCKIFKQCFGVSFVMYLADLRVRKAKEMLADITINIKEISGLVGYQDPNYFTKVFKRVENCTPSEYRARVLG